MQPRLDGKHDPGESPPLAERHPLDPQTDAKPGRFRWLICLLLFCITVSNYLDRQVLSIAAPVIAPLYHLTNSDIAAIANAFLLAYTFGQLFAGLFVDWIGARTGFTLAVILWSVTAIFTSAARGVVSFCSFRFLLGASESVNYPGGVKVAAEWFAPKELATAVGLFQSGSSIGAMIAPALAAYFIVKFGWQAAFVLVAIPGLLWIPFWLKYYQPLETSTRVGEAERAYVLANRDPRASIGVGHVKWWTFLQKRAVWGVALARFFEEPVAWFYFTWLPLYLKTAHTVSLIDTGLFLIIPFLTFDIGKVGGGWLSSQLIRAGWTLDHSRKTVMLGSALIMLSSIPAVAAHTSAGFVALISLATFGHGCWATTAQTLPGDMVAPAWVGTVYGITALGGGLGSIIFMYLTGKMVDAQKSFTTPFVVAGVLPIIGYVVFMSLTGKIRPLDLERATPRMTR